MVHYQRTDEDGERILKSTPKACAQQGTTSLRLTRQRERPGGTWYFPRARLRDFCHCGWYLDVDLSKGLPGGNSVERQGTSSTNASAVPTRYKHDVEQHKDNVQSGLLTGVKGHDETVGNESDESGSAVAAVRDGCTWMRSIWSVVARGVMQKPTEFACRWSPLLRTNNRPPRRFSYCCSRRVLVETAASMHAAAGKEGEGGGGSGEGPSSTLWIEE